MSIASYIDHTALKPTTTEKEIRKLCDEATEYQFAAVCIPPFYVDQAKKQLEKSDVKIATVIGFPFGYNCTTSKLKEIEDVVSKDVDELDVVINLAALKNGDWKFIETEVKAFTNVIHQAGKIIKLIVESGLLTDEELIRTCKIVANNNIDFIKTSTGYAEIGATLHAVKLMRHNLHNGIFIKASGGIRTFGFAKELLDAGANRLGCSASVQIVKEQT